MPNNPISVKKIIQIFQMALKDDFVNNVSKKTDTSWQTARKYMIVMNELVSELTDQGMDEMNSKVVAGIILEKLKNVMG